MKTNKLLITITTLLTAIAGAQTQTTRMSPEADAWLNKKLAQAKTTDNGATVQFVSKKLITDALDKVGNKASIDFGGTQILKTTPQKKSGVLVGSGADNLVATASADSTGPVVVQPPILPKTSLTVVGRLGKSQPNMKICAKQIKTDSQGKIIHGGGMTDPVNSCAPLNIPLRISEGLYQVFFIYMYSGNSQPRQGLGITVKVDAGENKVIPLREISVPKYGNKIQFTVTEERSSEVFLRSIATQMFSACSASEKDTNILCDSMAFGVVEDLYKDIRDTKSPEDLYENVYKHMLNTDAVPFTLYISGVLDDEISNRLTPGPASDGDFVSVFPGVYRINWQIDGQKDTTRNIVVE
jgi:hypothetical protein